MKSVGWIGLWFGLLDLRCTAFFGKSTSHSIRLRWSAHAKLSRLYLASDVQETSILWKRCEIRAHHPLKKNINKNNEELVTMTSFSMPIPDGRAGSGHEFVVASHSQATGNDQSSIQKRTGDRSSTKSHVHLKYYFLTLNPTLSLNVYIRHVRSLPALPVPTPEARIVLQTPWCPYPYWVTDVGFRRV